MTAHAPIKVLFISHDASRTGAPIVLLHLLEWLKNNSNIQLMIMLKKGGVLEKNFQSLGETLIWQQGRLHTLDRIKKKLSTLVKIISFSMIDLAHSHQQTKMKEQLQQFKPDLIYANSVVSTDLAADLCQLLACPLVCHLHELEMAINRYFGKENFLQVRHKIDYYIAVSAAVTQNLLTNHAIPQEKIKKINPFIPAVEYSQQKNTSPELRSELSIPQEAIVIGGCGTTDWRKSPDLFIQIAYLVMQKNRGKSIYFVWIGGRDEQEKRQLSYDIEKLNLTNVFFLGEKKEPLAYFKLFDLFLLSSREDPYPLVCLEAAALGKPILCFDNAGGMPEFVSNDCGIVAPYLDVDYMANAITQLIADEDLRKTLGDNARRKVIAQHDIAVASQAIEKYLLEITSR